MLIGVKEAENGSKRGRKLVATGDDVNFRRSDRLELPFTVNIYDYRFQHQIPFLAVIFRNNGLPFEKSSC